MVLYVLCLLRSEAEILKRQRKNSSRLDLHGFFELGYLFTVLWCSAKTCKINLMVLYVLCLLRSEAEILKRQRKNSSRRVVGSSEAC